VAGARKKVEGKRDSTGTQVALTPSTALPLQWHGFDQHWQSE